MIIYRTNITFHIYAVDIKSKVGSRHIPKCLIEVADTGVHGTNNKGSNLQLQSSFIQTTVL